MLIVKLLFSQPARLISSPRVWRFRRSADQQGGDSSDHSHRCQRRHDSALRRAFSDASVRLQPTTRITDIVAALETLGVTATVEDGLLVLKQGSTEMSTNRALRYFAARPEHSSFFVLTTADPKTWTVGQKTEYLRTHSAEEFGRLCLQPVLDAGIKTLDANMSRADYSKLTRAEKQAFIREYGDEGVSRVFGKPA